MKLYNFLALFLAIALPSISVAQSSKVVLFIDTNFSYREIQEAQKAATSRGEKLVVVPEMPDRKVGVAAKEAYQSASWNLYKAKKAGQSAAILTDLSNKRAQALQAYHNFLLSHRFNDFDIQSALAKIKENGDVVSTLILSGHSAGFQFTGELTTTTLQNIVSYFNQFPGLSDGIKTIYLWGCYTNGVGYFDYWSPHFANLQLLVGFEKRAPSADSLESPATLKAAMLKQDTLMATTSTTEFLGQYKSLRLLPQPKMDETDLSIYSKACQCYVGPPQKDMSGKIQPIRVMTQNEIDGWCSESKLNVLRTNLKLYGDYKNASNGKDDVPYDTARSELRSAYESLRVNQACSTKMNITVAQIDSMILLIYFNKIKANFVTYFNNEIAQANQTLARGQSRIQFPTFSSASGEEKITRKEFLSRMSDLSYPALPSDATEAEVKNVRSMTKRYQYMLGEFYCVPMQWIETKSTKAALANPAAAGFGCGNYVDL